MLENNYFSSDSAELLTYLLWDFDHVFRKPTLAEELWDTLLDR